MYPKGFRSYHGVPGTIKECVATLQPPFIATGPVLHWYQGYGQAQTFWEMHPNFQRFSPKLKVTTFLSRPAKLNYKSNDFFTSASQAGWLGNCRSLQNIAFTEPAFPSLGFSSQPSLDGWRFIWGHRQITIWGNAFPDCTFSTLILVLPRGTS